MTAFEASPRVLRLNALSVGILAAIMLALLQYRLLFEGWALSYDAALYARSLWGFGHGDFHNPIAGVHSLAIHGHFTAIPFGLLTRLMPAGAVLILMQSLAFGATVSLFGHALSQSRFFERSRLVGAWVSLPLIIASPLVMNPFLYDARPCVMAVPLALAGMLLVAKTRNFGPAAVALMVLAILTREEFAIAVAGACLFAPSDRGLRDPGRQALLLFATAYWFTYWFGIRPWLGDALAVERAEAASALLDATVGQDGHGWLWFAKYKVEIFLISILTAGGLSLRSWRWLLAAGPCVGILLVTGRMQETVLTFHYAMFAAPALLVAATVGADTELPRWARPAIAIVACACFLVASSAPFGGRFRAENYALNATLVRSELEWQPDRESYLASHRAAAALDGDASIAVPYPLALPVCDRDEIITIGDAVAAGPTSLVERDVEYVVIDRPSSAQFGRILVGAGYRFAGVSEHQRLALLRLPDASNEWQLPAGVRVSPCGDAVVWSDQASVLLCSAEPTDAGLRLWLTRGDGGTSYGSHVRFALTDDTGMGVFEAVGGLWPVDQLISGVQVPFELGVTGWQNMVLVLLDEQGNALPLQTGTDPARSSIAISEILRGRRD